MRLQKIARGTVVGVYVKPNSKEFQVRIEDDELVVFCREVPVKGKVNRELVKKLSRVFDKKVEILSGLTSRQKKILIQDVTEEEVKTLLSRFTSE